ncbi:AMP-dependent synthetase/ligase [Nocardia sp. CA2R105]|nr:AMP-dependent synthetase/ligase [Nocardia coffeae]
MTSMTVYTGDTLVALFRAAVADRGDAPALIGPGGSMSWNQYARQVDSLAARLLSWGLEWGQRVALVMDNSPEFHIADMAVLVAGGVPFSIDPRDAPARLAGLLAVASPPILIADDHHLATARSLASESAVARVVCATDIPEPGEATDVADRPQPGAQDIATLIFTSGTTGAPKAVQLAHRAIVSSLRSTDAVAPMGRAGRVLSYLPLTHIAERFMSYYFALATGSTIYCVPDAAVLYDRIISVRPTRFFAVPRVYEKLSARARALRAAEPNLSGPEVIAALGLGETEYRGVATAPSSQELLRFFADLGSPVSNIWGMSEAIMCTVNPPERIVEGSVGVFLGSCEGAVASDGELLVRGSNVMSGYLGDPERTAEVLDEQGWLHTGDLGRIDDDGYLFLIGRKKDVLVTATGKNVVPTVVEQAVINRTDLLSLVVAIAEGRRYVTALLVPDEENLAAFARSLGLAGPIAELIRHPEVRAAIERAIAKANTVLAKAETIRNWVLLPAEWQPGSDELTATMKIRRSAVDDKYATEIDRMYT